MLPCTVMCAPVEGMYNVGARARHLGNTGGMPRVSYQLLVSSSAMQQMQYTVNTISCDEIWLCWCHFDHSRIHSLSRAPSSCCWVSR